MADNSSIPTKTHAELMRVFIGTVPNGIAVCTFGDGKMPTFAFSVETVNPELFHLLSAASLIYKVAANVRDMLEPLTVFMEKHGHEEVVDSLLQHQAAITIALRCATEGGDKILNTRK